MIHGLPEMIAARVLNSIPVGLGIAGLAWLGLRAFHKQGSGARFVIWFMALVGIAAVPFVPTFQSSTSSTVSSHPGLTLPAAWAVAIVGFWSAAVVLMAVRFGFGIWNLWKLRREASPVDASELPIEAQHALAEFRADRQVKVCRSTGVRVPTAIGFWKPTVLLPHWALRDLSDRDLTAVLLHELAHLRRRDDWTNLAGKLLGAVFFFHPAVWFVQRRLELEREMACDELVLAKTGNRHAYAECLVSLAEKSFARRSVAMAQAIIGHAKGTAIRLARILGPAQASPHSYASAMTFAFGVLGLCVFLAPGAPKFIAFKDAAPVKPSVAQQLAKATPEVMVSPVKGGTSFDPNTPTRKVRTTPAKSVVARKPQKPASEVLARETVPDAAHASRTQYLLVMQTQVDGNGELRTKFCVWKLTLREADNQAIRAQIVMSSL
jgi:beta-lactamase regulating signal transducer with metallopeptidase domain